MNFLMESKTYKKSANVIPLKGVNDIRFGMNRHKIRSILGNADSFKKTSDSKNETDAFGPYHIYYDNMDKCEAIELSNDVKIMINGKQLRTLTDAIKVIGKFEETEKGHHVSKNRSIGIYAPDKEIESLMVAKKGYFN